MSATTAKRIPATVHRRGDALLRGSLPYAATALLALLFCCYEFDLTNQDLRKPLGAPSGDYLLSATIVKGVMQHGWYTTNPMVGAPQGLDFHDFPMAEGLHFVFYQIAGILGLPVALAMNLHYILGYVLIALASLYVFRALRLPPAPSIAAGLLFAFMPRHWMRGQGHLMLSSYYMIPLTVLAILWLAGGEKFVERSPREARFRYRLTRRGIAAAVICALTGSAGIYYAFFAMAFFGIMAIFRFVRRPDVVQALTGLMPIAFICLFIILNVSPSLVYWIRHGSNNVVALRTPGEADLYGMKMVQLLMPIVNHRIARLAAWKTDYLITTSPYVPNNDAAVALGVVAGFGFLFLVAWLFFGQDDRTNDGQLLTHLSLLSMSGLLIATIGGFGSLFAHVVSPQIRTYSRISIYIAFFSLLAVLILIRRVQLLWFNSKSRAKLLHFAAAAVMFAGLWDITPPVLALEPTPAALAAEESDRNFIQSIEAAVPSGSMIYQLPYHPFPEYGPINKMQDYDPFRGYLYSDHLRWSYGAMRGRPADEWQKHVASLPLSQMLSTVAEAGFQGIYIDRNGYADAAEDLISHLAALLVESGVQSADRRFLFFPIGKYTAVLEHNYADWNARREKVLQLPVSLSWKGCSPPEDGGKHIWCPYDAEMQLENEGAADRWIHFQATFVSATGAPANLTFGPPISRTVQIAGGGQPSSLDVIVPPGTLRVKVHSDAKRLELATDPRLLVFNILNPEVTGDSPFANIRPPIGVSFTGCMPPTGGKDFWCPFDGALELTNSGSEPRSIRVSARIQTGASAPAVLTMGGLLTRSVPIGPGGVPFTADVTLPPGTSTITLHCDGKRYIVPSDARVLVFSITGLDVSDE